MKKQKFQNDPISSSKVIRKTAYFIQTGYYGIFKAIVGNFLSSPYLASEPL